MTRRAGAATAAARPATQGGGGGLGRVITGKPTTGRGSGQVTWPASETVTRETSGGENGAWIGAGLNDAGHTYQLTCAEEWITNRSYKFGNMSLKE